MTRLKRALGFPSLTFYGVGLIIGAGIYSVIGAAAGVAGNALWWSFALAALIALLTGLSYAELASAYPQAGAEYVYVGHAFPRHRWAAFVIGCILTVAVAGTAATVSIAFAGYLQLFVRVPSLPAALGVLLAGALINILGIKQASWVNIAFTLIEVAGLVLVIIVAVGAPRFGEAVRVPLSSDILAGAAVIFFVFLGFEEIANLSEEAERPAKDVPRAIFVSLAITTVLYILVAFSVVALTSPPQLAASSFPLATALATVSPAGARALGVMALFSTANTALLAMIAGSRMLFSMARSGQMPAVLSGVLPNRKTPWIAAIVVFAVAAALAPLGDVKVVGSLASLLSIIAFVSVHISLIVLRYREPRRKRPFRVPIRIGRFPLLPAFGVVSAVVLAFHFEPFVHLMGTVVIGTSLLAYWLVRRNLNGSRS